MAAPSIEGSTIELQEDYGFEIRPGLGFAFPQVRVCTLSWILGDHLELWGRDARFLLWFEEVLWNQFQTKFRVKRIRVRSDYFKSCWL
jgi:hypothetical protein